MLSADGLTKRKQIRKAAATIKVRNKKRRKKLRKKIPYDLHSHQIKIVFITFVIGLFIFEYLFLHDISVIIKSDITASFLLIKNQSTNECYTSKSLNNENDVIFFPSDKPLIVEGFPNTPIIGNDFLDINGPYNSILFKARSSKFPNGPILSTGSNMLFEQTDIEYRLMEVRGYLNYSAIRDDEGVESDFCIDLIPLDKINSVSSGEEVLCAHETFYGGDRSPIINRQSSHNAPFVEFQFGPHGIPLKSNQKLSIASVSKIYTKKKFNPLSAKETAARNAPSEPIDVPGLGKVKTSLDLLALMFEAVIVPVRSESEAPQGLRSVRIPQRDRSAMPFMDSKDAMPLTAYQNVGDYPISIEGIGIFRSVLQYYVAGHTTIKIFVNEIEVLTYCPQPHLPGTSSAKFEETIPINVDLQPNEIVRVEHTLSSYVPQQFLNNGRYDLPKIYDPTPYDLVIYILYENGKNAPDVSVLVPFEETDFVDANGGLDLNNDGIDDFVEYDIAGTIWKELSSPEGVHDTQHIGFRNLITKKGKFNKKTTSWVWERNVVTKFMEATVTDNIENICFHLKAKVRSGLNFLFIIIKFTFR